MDNNTIDQIWALTEMVKALTLGLEAAVTLMDKWDLVTRDQRENMMNNLNTVIAKSKEVYGEKPIQH